MMGNNSGRGKAALGVLLSAFLLASIVIACLAASGCENSETSYKNQLVSAMQQFNTRDEQVGKKLQAILKKQNFSVQDLTNLVQDTKQLIQNGDTTFQKVAKLTPPEKYWKLHAITLYYLLAYSDYLKSTGDLYQAVLSGKPTEDLKKVAQDYLARKESLRQELAIELQTQGTDLSKQPNKKPSSSAAPKPTSSATVPQPAGSSTSPAK